MAYIGCCGSVQASGAAKRHIEERDAVFEHYLKQMSGAALAKAARYLSNVNL
jgi:hypothetical protein